MEDKLQSYSNQTDNNYDNNLDDEENIQDEAYTETELLLLRKLAKEIQDSMDREARHN